MSSANNAAEDIKDFASGKGRSIYAKFGGFSAPALILFGFFLILFSVITYDGLIMFLMSFIPGALLVFFGFLIFAGYIRALRYYGFYSMGIRSLQELSDIMTVSKASLKKDIGYMASRGIMPNAYFDDDDNLSFGSEKKREEADKPKDEIREEKHISSIDEWHKHLDVIKAAENEFKSEDLSYALFGIGKVLEQIFIYLDAHPDKEGELKKLMDFHLPSALKLIDSYRELNKSGIKSFSVNKTKEDILSACDKIREAFQGVLKDLYEGTAIDVSADITVLKMMLAREGFLDRDVFNIKK